MRKLLMVLALVIAGVVVWKGVNGGAMPLTGKSESAEDRQVQALEEKFQQAQKHLAQAERAAGVSGLDTSGDAAAALSEAEQVEKSLHRLQSELTESAAMGRAKDLLKEVQEFRRRTGS
jgi:DNA-binding protein YbaB